MNLTAIEKSALEILLKAYERDSDDAYVLSKDIETALGVSSYGRFAAQLLNAGWIRSGFVRRERPGWLALAWRLTTAGYEQLTKKNREQRLHPTKDFLKHQLRDFLGRISVSNTEWRQEANIMLVLLDAEA